MKMKLLLLLTCVGAILCCCDTQESLTESEKDFFIKFFGNEGNQQGVDFVVNSDGSVILIGNSRVAEDSVQKIYVAKADVGGKIVWEKTIGGKFETEVKDIELLADQSVLILANTANTPARDEANRERDVLLVKLNQNGDELARVKQGLTSDPLNVVGTPTDEDASSISVINDGFIIAGSKAFVPKPSVNRSGFMHMRFRSDLTWVSDISGQWNSEPVFPLNGESKTVKVVQSGTFFYAMGYANDNFRTSSPLVSDFNFLIYGLGPSGGDLGKIYIGDITSNEKLTGVSIVPNELGGGYLLTGPTKPLDNSTGDLYLTRLSRSINFDQFNTSNFILPPRTLALGNPLVNGSSNYVSLYNFLITSERRSGDSDDIYLTKSDVSGNPVFTRDFGGVSSDYSGPVVELPDRRIMMIGTMTVGGIDGQTKIALFKLNSQGRLAP